ncbi:PfkB family carbohydrate kinase [Amycolatopsis sp. MtRt-6]|uniref:PfkB family carbohydrate kinase n=1 Tax=Amycolatopsis sp. MtRt-6 TaxID=2792782 RepID=UPI001A8D71BC|nr:PfkB family carbohydrate kinase [Amycolatopsis sp. MtRt-6]
MTGSVVVVGAVNVDHVVVTGRLPRAGETVVGPAMVRHGGGKGANAAVAAARFGAHVRLIGAVGTDDVAAGALAELAEAGVDVASVERLAEVPTGAAVIVVDAAGENQIAVGAGANAHVDPDRVRASLRAVLPSCGCVLVSTEIPEAAVAAAVEEATAAGVCCVLNPAPVVPVVAELLRHGPVLTPNRGEAAELAPDLPTLAARTGAPVVVTLGGEGVRYVLPGESPVDVAPHRTKVVDTTGAGDTFNGVLAARLAAGDPLDRAVRTANVAAALSVTAPGARAGGPAPAEVEAALAPARP